MIKKGLQGKTITVKTKDENFIQRTKSKTISNYTNIAEEIYANAATLLDEMDLETRLRLVGLTMSNLMSLDLEQLSFFDD